MHRNCIIIDKNGSLWLTFSQDLYKTETIFCNEVPVMHMAGKRHFSSQHTEPWCKQQRCLPPLFTLSSSPFSSLLLITQAILPLSILSVIILVVLIIL